MYVNKIKTIFFDLGQTLVQLLPISSCMQGSLKKHFPELDIDLNELIYAWGHGTHKLFMELREKDFINVREIHFLSLKKILKICKINITDKLARTIVEDVWQDFIKNNKLYPDALSVLNQLKQSGYTLGIITDCDVDVANGIMQKHNLKNFFEVKVISSEIKAYKPNPLPFNEALKLAKCLPDEGIYVGDSEIDIKGANDVGLITVIVSRNELQDTKMDIRPDFRINCLSELPELISKINKT